ncbi:MAG: hypothetical protein AB7O24_28390 [Kofleriaceae bacterium]
MTKQTKPVQTVAVKSTKTDKQVAKVLSVLTGIQAGPSCRRC